ncbi:MAG TPA: hypothetical protein VFI34_07675 [Candidatus Limnocylindrales bacterium]|nr:hypothetical protein [Candidatus Limnocylindrales bacterium]
MTATLEFRGLDLLSQQTDSAGEGLRIPVVRGFLGIPDMRGKDYVVAAAGGRSSGNRVADVLAVGLAGFVTARTPAAWRALTDQLLAVLDENGADAGTLTARGPYLGLASGAVATIDVRVKNVIEGPILAKLYQTWSIELESVDPYWVVTNP